MQFQLNRPVADPLALLRALKSHDPLAQIELDAARGTVDVRGKLDMAQAAAAFREVGLVASPLAERAPHVSGTSTCCGHCA
ncbi:MAG: hypothetical protein EOP90_00945 [Lysobacteraceae bacterium]|nr:MAG: hypothetical protein EOP90_00945 [Xanthomonadaceae bacterium]